MKLLPALVVGMLALASAALAQEPSYPNRPIRIIVPFPAGGPSDIVARLLGQRLSEGWG
jgi:tripartite-type tricarboxylate transporter receptor subunit TctC